MADLTAKMILELVDRLSGPAKQAARRMSAMTRSATNMAKSFERITTSGRQARRVLRQLGADAKKLPSTRGFAGGTARAGAGVGRGGPFGDRPGPRGAHSIWGRGTMAQAGRDMGRFGRVSLGAMTGVINIFADFDQKMQDVAAVTRGLAQDPDKFEAIRAKAKQIGRETKFSAVEAASGFEMLGMAGVDAADQLTMIDHVMNLSAAGAMNLGQATDIATDVMMGFNLEADQMGRIANVLAVGATSATTTVAGLGKGLAKVAPAAATLGVSLEETTAFLAAFANMGLKGGIGGRSLRRILISLVAPSKRAKAAMDELEVATTDASGKMRRPVEIFQDLTMALRKLPEAERVAKLHKIFQAFGMVGAAGAVQQFNKALSKTPKDAEELNDILKILGRMMDSDGAAAEMAATRFNSMRGDTQRLVSALKDLAITVVEELGPGLRDLIGDATMAVRSFSKFAQENKGLVKWLLKTWAAVAVLTAVFGPLIVAVDTLVKLWMITKSIRAAGMFTRIGVGLGKAAKAASFLGAGLGKTISLLMTPAGAVTGGVIAGATMIIMWARSEMALLRKESEQLAANIRGWMPKTVKAQKTKQLGARAEVLTGRIEKEQERIKKHREGFFSFMDPILGTTADTTALDGLREELRQTRAELEKRTGGMGPEFAGPTQEMALKVKVESDVPVRTTVDLEQIPGNWRALIENFGLQGSGA